MAGSSGECVTRPERFRPSRFCARVDRMLAATKVAPPNRVRFAGTGPQHDAPRDAACRSTMNTQYLGILSVCRTKRDMHTQVGGRGFSEVRADQWST